MHNITHVFSAGRKHVQHSWVGSLKINLANSAVTSTCMLTKRARILLMFWAENRLLGPWGNKMKFMPLARGNWGQSYQITEYTLNSGGQTTRTLTIGPPTIGHPTTGLRTTGPRTTRFLENWFPDNWSPYTVVFLVHLL